MAPAAARRAELGSGVGDLVAAIAVVAGRRHQQRVVVGRVRERAREGRALEVVAAEAQVDHAHAVPYRPHDRTGHGVAEEETGRRDADRHHLRRARDATAADAVAGDHRDHTRDHRPVPDAVRHVRPAARGVVAERRDAPGEIGLVRIDAGVDDARPGSSSRRRRPRSPGRHPPRRRPRSTRCPSRRRGRSRCRAWAGRRAPARRQPHRGACGADRAGAPDDGCAATSTRRGPSDSTGPTWSPRTARSTVAGRAPCASATSMRTGAADAIAPGADAAPPTSSAIGSSMRARPCIREAA